jgi:hypothetical protein
VNYRLDSAGRDCGALPVSILAADSLRLAWLSLDDHAVHQFVTLPEQVRAEVPYLDEVASLPVPFAGCPIVASAGDLVYVGYSDDATINVYDRQGFLQRSLRWRAVGAPLTAAVRARFDSTRLRLDAAVRPGATRQVPELAAFTLPQRLPVFAQLVPGDDGSLWVRRHPLDWDRFEQSYGPAMAAGSNDWWVFDFTGRLQGIAALPVGFVLKAIEAGMALGVRADAEGFLLIELIPLRS